MFPHFGDFSHWNLVDELSSQHRGSGTPSGSGHILDTLTRLPVGRVVIFAVTGTLGIGQQVDNEVVVMPPVGIIAPDLSNIRATAHTQSAGYRVMLPVVLNSSQP